MRRDYMSTGNLKGNPMTTRWICGLLCLISIVAYSRMPVVLNGAAELLSQTRASPAIAVRAPSGSTAPSASGSRDNDFSVTTNLSAYMYLHETRNMSNPLRATASANVCAR